jgi:glycosyltransferase involved in cell wall biosynthesis
VKIAIATDAWFPQINGVVRTLSTTINMLLDRGFEIELITPDQFITVPMPGYREIRLAVAPRFGARRALHSFKPDIVHIATEGPIGWSARGWCLAHNIPYTSAFHTRFPDYASVRTGLSADRFWPIMRRFHRPARAVLATNPQLIQELEERGIRNARLWSRGVDTRLFHPDHIPHPAMANLPHPILLAVGRVSVEKNLEVFLGSAVAGTKVVVGDGPARASLELRYPDALFLGCLESKALASAYAAADVLVFPSRTDTFGLVMIEALACGVPVAAYPVPGPLDILGHHGRGPDNALDRPVGALDESLSRAIFRAQSIKREDAVAFGRKFDWSLCTDQFIEAIRDVSGQAARDSVLEPIMAFPTEALLGTCGENAGSSGLE